MVENVLKKVIIEKNVLGAVDYSRDIISNLLQGKIRYSKLIITRALSRRASEYKSKAAHVELAQVIEKRDPGNAYKLGDRVRYVVVPGTKGQKTYELGEDPLYAFEHGISPDYNWYLEKQIRKPLQRIFYYVFKNAEVLKSMIDKEKDAEWIKVHGLGIDGLTERDLIDEDELEEDREEAEELAAQYRDGDDIYEGHNEGNSPIPQPKPSFVEAISPSAPPTQKRKSENIADYFGFKVAKVEPKTTASKTKKQKEKEHLKKMKKQQDAMDHSIGASILFSGAHTRKIVKASLTDIKPLEKLGETSSKGVHGIAKFLETVPNCQVCSNPTRSSQKAVCEACELNIPAISEAKKRAIARIEEIEKETQRCLGICETCVKDNPSVEFLTCRNVDCDNLWDRMTAWRNLSKEQRLKSLEW
jgi:ribosomal protein L34E